MSEAFPVEQFRDVFQVTPKIKNKLQPFMAQYKALNMYPSAYLGIGSSIVSRNYTAIFSKIGTISRLNSTLFSASSSSSTQQKLSLSIWSKSISFRSYLKLPASMPKVVKIREELAILPVLDTLNKHPISKNSVIILSDWQASSCKWQPQSRPNDSTWMKKLMILRTMLKLANACSNWDGSLMQSQPTIKTLLQPLLHNIKRVFRLLTK